MSGNPAFQGNSFQNSAFQAGAIVVAGNYWLASPSFAAPALGANYHFTSPAYSLGPLDIPVVGKIVFAFNVFTYSLGPLGFTPVGPIKFNYHLTAPVYAVASPAFAKPILASGSNYDALHVNPYSLGALGWQFVSIRTTQYLKINAYSVGSPTFGTSAVGQNYRLFSNTYAITGPLGFATPLVGTNYHFSGVAFSVGPLAWAPVGPIIVNHVLSAASYSLGSPSFNYPRLQWQVVTIDLPPTYLTQIEQATDILVGMLNTLLSSIPPSPTTERDTVRVLINELRSNAEAAIRGNTLGTQLQQVFAACIPAGATFAGLDATRLYLMSQAADTSPFSQAIFRNALVMTLATQSQIVANMAFTTQTEIQNMLLYMRDSFDAAKALGIDEVDVTLYQTLNAMGGALINHLARSELQLPRYMTYVSGMPMPSLYLANRIYADETQNIEIRASEIELENGVVNPAFCPRTLRVLSTVEPGIATR
jgi:hypothetical protein